MSTPPNLICIVDDDASVRRALGRLVCSFGYEVILFASGRQCLDYPRLDATACLIIDVKMPDLDGYELHTLLTAAGHTIPTIFISAHDFSKRKQHAHQSELIEFINKPCDEMILYNAINNVIPT